MVMLRWWGWWKGAMRGRKAWREGVMAVVCMGQKKPTKIAKETLIYFSFV
jgi:hypothetical protein